MMVVRERCKRLLAGTLYLCDVVEVPGQFGEFGAGLSARGLCETALRSCSIHQRLHVLPLTARKQG